MEPKKLLTTLALVTVVLIAGCKKDTFVETVGLCPEVISTVPANLATGVPLNQVITATFNKVMDPATITQASFTVKGASAITGTVSYSGTTATFVPSSPLTPNTTYTGTILKSVKDLIRQSPKYDYVWTFTTIMPSYTVAVSTNPSTLSNKPTVTGSSPFISGSSVTVTAAANAGYAFTNWTESGTTLSITTAAYTFNISGNRTLVANYTAQYTVAVLTNPSTLSNKPTVTGVGPFNSGSPVTVTALANTGYTFTNWTESGTTLSITTPVYTFNISGNRTLVANYTAAVSSYTVEVSTNPSTLSNQPTVTGGGPFNSGSPVTVTALANTGYTFTNWTEIGTTLSITTAVYTFNITGDRKLVANYTADAITSYTVTLSANPLAGGTQTGAGPYNSGASVTVTAIPAVGYTFTYWTESGTALLITTPVYTFNITGDRKLVANYANILYTVTLSANPSEGGTPSGGGTFHYGNSVTVRANPAVGYTFKNWTESGIIVPEAALAEYTFTISRNRSLVANFTINTYTLNVTAIHGTVEKNPLLGPYNYGTTVTLTPTPDIGYTFTSWSGDATGFDNPLPVTMNADKNITANFTLNSYSLNVTINPSGGGTVEKNPLLGLYNHGTTVTLTETPNTDYTFTSWTGDASGSATTTSVLMTANKAVTANFTLISAVCPTIVNLGTSGDFVILANSGISTKVGTYITGDIGTGPAVTSTAITGFDLLSPPSTYTISSLVNGKVYAYDYDVPTPSKMNTASLDMGLAFGAANAIASTVTELGAGTLSGNTLVTGVYKWSSNVLIATDIWLDGGGDNCAKFIFQIAGYLTVANGVTIHLQNGANAKNIFWAVAGSKVELGTTVDFSGNILSKTLISLNTGAKVTGRLLAQTAVTLDVNTIVKLPL